MVGFDTYAYSGPNVEVTEAASAATLRLPILNDLIFAGVPHLGNPSAGGLYLPQVLTLVFGTNRGMGVLVALHLVVLGTGMVWLTRRLGMNRLGATAAGVLLVASGAMLTKTVQYEQILVIAWAPLLLVAIHAVLHNDRPWRAIGRVAAVTAAIVLAGHPQLVYETALLAAAATIGFAIGGERRQRLPHLAVGAVLGLLIAAPQLVGGPVRHVGQRACRSAAIKTSSIRELAMLPTRPRGHSSARCRTSTRRASSAASRASPSSGSSARWWRSWA